jgi:hypothetical protein
MLGVSPYQALRNAHSLSAPPFPSIDLPLSMRTTAYVLDCFPFHSRNDLQYTRLTISVRQRTASHFFNSYAAASHLTFDAYTPPIRSFPRRCLTVYILAALDVLSSSSGLTNECPYPMPATAFATNSIEGHRRNAFRK